MRNSNWKPQEKLIEKGWYFLDFITEKEMSDRFRDEQLDRFLDTLAIKSESQGGKKLYEMYVKPYPFPLSKEPGGGFVQMGCRTKNQILDEKYLQLLKTMFRAFNNREVASVLRLDGPIFIPSVVDENKYEANYVGGKIIYMR